MFTLLRSINGDFINNNHLYTINIKNERNHIDNSINNKRGSDEQVQVRLHRCQQSAWFSGSARASRPRGREFEPRLGRFFFKKKNFNNFQICRKNSKLPQLVY